MNRRWIQLVAVIVTIVFAVGIMISGDEVKTSWLRFFGIAVFVTISVIGAWERFVWKLPFVQKIQDVPINLNGTWKGRLVPLSKLPDGSSIAPKDAYLVVRQSASKVSAALLTGESKSRSSLAEIEIINNEKYLNYLYSNKPALRHQDRSRPHRGAVSLDISGHPAEALEGKYWTDRDTKGELHFLEHSPGFADSISTAEALFA